MEINKVYQGDCIEILKDIPDSSVDCVVTDPPYNIGKDFTNDNLPKKEYLNWCLKWIPELNRVLKYGGSIWITLGWQCVAEIKVLFDKIKDLRLKNWIVWYRQDGWKGDGGFAQSYEHILYFVKDNKDHPLLKEFGEYIKQKRKQKGYTTKKCRELTGKTIYDSCGNAGWLWVETGRVPNKDEYAKIKEILDLDDSFDKFIEENYVKFNKVDECNDLWLNPKSEHKRLGHPTQKPFALFERMVLSCTNEGDIILDPFIGSGTTAFVCEKNKRGWVGIEINPEYVALINKRMKQKFIHHFEKDVGGYEKNIVSKNNNFASQPSNEGDIIIAKSNKIPLRNFTSDSTSRTFANAKGT